MRVVARALGEARVGALSFEEASTPTLEVVSVAPFRGEVSGVAVPAGARFTIDGYELPRARPGVDRFKEVRFRLTPHAPGLPVPTYVTLGEIMGAFDAVPGTGPRGEEEELAGPSALEVARSRPTIGPPRGAPSGVSYPIGAPDDGATIVDPTVVARPSYVKRIPRPR